MKRYMYRFFTISLFLVATLSYSAHINNSAAQVKEGDKSAPVYSAQTPASFADLSEELLPSVVNISSTQKTIQPEDFPEMPHFPPGSPFEDFFEEFMGKRGQGMPAIPPASLGSGFIVDAENGYIVTNYHVIKDAEEIRVTLHDDTTLEAKIVGHDAKTDIAVLKVETETPLSAVVFGDSDNMRVGDWVLAIGNPFGLGGTVTAGIISARQRDINSGPYDDYIQTDASINRGNSGGPMFDLNGHVIGINTAIFSPSGGSVGIGFAIPSSLARPVINQLIEYGRTRRGWLGVRIQSVTDEIAEGLGLKEEQGALIASVTETGPAEKSGLKAGDVILKFDGKEIDTMRNLPRIVAETKIGEEVEVEYWRNGKREKSTVTVGELEKAEENGLIDSRAASPDGPIEEDEKQTVIPSFGLSLSKITDADRTAYSIPDDVNGVLITDIKSTSVAAEKGLIVGDVIVEINQQPLTEPQEAADIIEKAEKAGRSSVLLLISHEGDAHFEALRFKRD